MIVLQASKFVPIVNYLGRHLTAEAVSVIHLSISFHICSGARAFHQDRVACTKHQQYRYQDYWSTSSPRPPFLILCHLPVHTVVLILVLDRGESVDGWLVVELQPSVRRHACRLTFLEDALRRAGIGVTKGRLLQRRKTSLIEFRVAGCWAGWHRGDG